MTSILTLQHKWPGLKQGFEVTRERTEHGKTTVEVVYGITNLGPEEADARRLLALVRDHWRIENCLHWVRDMTLGEDACRVRTGNAPEVLAALRNAVVHLLSQEVRPSKARDSRAAVCHRFAARPTEALQVIGLPLCE